ncbi:MAG: hypothetical protein L6416_09815 [Candidatus Omnitrophica bacterium]|nr:hypothetical protein [Candidatus Omnitrophota bacterium]
MVKKLLRKISPMKVRIFKIANRRGYAAISLNNLTEGTTANQAYQRMIKALKRQGYELAVLAGDRVKKRIVSRI